MNEKTKMTEKKLRAINVYVPETIVKIKYDRLTFFDSLACLAMGVGFILTGVTITLWASK